MTAPLDPCPTLPIPSTCRNRNVVYREFGPNAVGDGSYFADQAPWRLGFNRTQNTIWIAKFRTEANTYRGRVSAYGDSSGGVAYIATDPCDPTSAIADKTAVYGNHGGGSIDFIVVNSAADAATLKSTYPYSYSPQLKADHCYYAVFQNVAEVPQALVDKAFLDSSTDTCGANTGGVCYYLAFDFGHRLHDMATGTLFAGSVIAGFTK